MSIELKVILTCMILVLMCALTLAAEGYMGEKKTKKIEEGPPWIRAVNFIGVLSIFVMPAAITSAIWRLA